LSNDLKDHSLGTQMLSQLADAPDALAVFQASAILFRSTCVDEKPFLPAGFCRYCPYKKTLLD